MDSSDYTKVMANLEQEIEKTKQALRGLGDESYATFSRLESEAGKAYGSLTQSAQLHALQLEQTVQLLRKNSEEQEILRNMLQAGVISVTEYTQAQNVLFNEQADLKAQAAEYSRLLDGEVEKLTSSAMEMERKIQLLAQLKSEYANLNEEERKSEKVGGKLLTQISQLSDEIRNQQSLLGKAKSGTGELVGAFAQLPGPLGKSASTLQQFSGTAGKLLSSGIGKMAGGIGVAFMAAKTAIEGSEKATNRLNAALAAFRSVGDSAQKTLSLMGSAAVSFFSGNWNAAADKMKQGVDVMANSLDNAKLAGNAAQGAAALKKEAEAVQHMLQTNNLYIDQYKRKLLEANLSRTEEKTLLEELRKLYEQNNQAQQGLLSKTYSNFKDANQTSFDLIKPGSRKDLEEAEAILKRLTQGEIVSHEEVSRMNELLRAVMDGMDIGLGDKKEEFLSFFSQAHKLNMSAHAELSSLMKSGGSAMPAMTEPESPAKSRMEELQEEVGKRKEMYSTLASFERQMGKEAARDAFGYWYEEGENLSAWLENKLQALMNKEGRTEEDNLELAYLADESRNAFDPAPLTAELEEKKAFYQEDLMAYLMYLQEKSDALVNSTSYASQEEKRILDEAIAQEKEAQDAKLQELLAKYQDFATKRSSLAASFEAEENFLQSAADNPANSKHQEEILKALKEMKKVHADTLSGMDADMASTNLTLFGNLEEISKSALKKAIREAKKFIEELKANGDPGPETEKIISKIEGQINNAQKTLKSDRTLAKDFEQVSKSLKECADMAALFDSGLANCLEIASEIAGAAGNIAGGIAMMGANPVQGIGMALSGVTGLISSFGKRIQENNRIRKEYQKGLLETYSKELEYNSILRDRLRTQQQIGETTLQYQERIRKELAQQSSAINKEYDEVWNKLMGEKYVSGQEYKHGTWFRKAKVTTQYGSLAGKSYEEIEKLYTQDKLDESAKLLFERLKQLKDEGADVVEMMEQINQSAREAWTGTTASSITDSIVQGFLDGKRSAEDFAGDFEDMMKKAMMQSLKLKYLEGEFNRWYDKFATASENGLTAADIQNLQEDFNHIIETAGKQMEDLERITGITISDAATTVSDNSLSGAYAKASQESIDLLAGQTGALRVTVEHIHTGMIDLYDLQERGWNDVAEIKNSVVKIEGYSKVTKEAVDRMSLHGVKINMN